MIERVIPFEERKNKACQCNESLIDLLPEIVDFLEEHRLKYQTISRCGRKRHMGLTYRSLDGDAGAVCLACEVIAALNNEKSRSGSDVLVDGITHVIQSKDDLAYRVIPPLPDEDAEKFKNYLEKIRELVSTRDTIIVDIFDGLLGVRL